MLFPCADPDNWKIDAWEFDWVNLNVIRDRAAIAHARNKPIIIEETGMKVHQQFLLPCGQACPGRVEHASPHIMRSMPPNDTCHAVMNF